MADWTPLAEVFIWDDLFEVAFESWSLSRLVRLKPLLDLEILLRISLFDFMPEWFVLDCPDGLPSRFLMILDLRA